MAVTFGNAEIEVVRVRRIETVSSNDVAILAIGTKSNIIRRLGIYENTSRDPSSLFSTADKKFSVTTGRGLAHFSGSTFERDVGLRIIWICSQRWNSLDDFIPGV
jgi:hypothetical protein